MVADTEFIPVGCQVGKFIITSPAFQLPHGRVRAWYCKCWSVGRGEEDVRVADLLRLLRKLSDTPPLKNTMKNIDRGIRLERSRAARRLARAAQVAAVR